MSSFFEIIEGRTQSDRDRKPLNKCNICDQEMGPYDMYVVAKAYQDGRCVLEAVQCMSCQMDSRDYASEQSMENIMLYSGRRFNEFINDPHRREFYHLEDPSCLITGETLTPKDTFELYHFNLPGSNMDDQNYLFVGPTAMEQMSELLSEETRKSWGRFLEELAPDAPDIVISPIFM